MKRGRAHTFTLPRLQQQDGSLLLEPLLSYAQHTKPFLASCSGQQASQAQWGLALPATLLQSAPTPATPTITRSGVLNKAESVQNLAPAWQLALLN